MPDLATRLRFEQLARRWMDDTSLESSTTKIILHPAHLQIIGMGKPVLPLILKSLEQEEALWFCALQSITGENPVPAEDTGRIPTMIQRWLAWGRDQGLL